MAKDKEPELTEEDRMLVAEVQAQRKAEADAQAAADVEAKRDAEMRATRKKEPKQYVGLDFSGNGTYEYRLLPHTLDRTLLVDGVNYEHVETDAEGVWLYRAQ